MYSDPDTWDMVMTKLSDTVTDYLEAQIESGAQAVQLFDSWGGELGPREFETFCAPGLRRIVEAVKARDVPVIFFGRGPLRDVGATAYGVDWTVDIAAARARGPVQGNLDPMVLFSPPEVVEQRVREMAEPIAGTGYVVNLGHGIHKDTPVEGAAAFVRAAQSVRCG